MICIEESNILPMVDKSFIQTVNGIVSGECMIPFMWRLVLLEFISIRKFNNFAYSNRMRDSVR